MSCPTAASLKQHIIEHEILGVGGSSGSSSILIVDGFPTYIDTTRGGKRLSLCRETFVATKKDKAKDIFLRTNSSIAGSKSSYRMLHNGTITGISLQLSASSTCDLHIYQNDLLVPLTTLSVTGLGNHSYSINADFAESDIIQFYLNGTCFNPVAWIELAWRF